MLKYSRKTVESGKCKVESGRKRIHRSFFAVRNLKNAWHFVFGKTLKNSLRSPLSTLHSNEVGMSMIGIMALMTILAIGLLAIAPSIHQSVQREKELESIRRGEEIAEAIKLYVEHYQGAKLPNSIDDLLEGLPQGTKKRQILRRSAATDPLSKDGKWRLISPSDRAFINFSKRVQVYNNGLLPSTPSKALNQYAIQLANIVNTNSEDDLQAVDESEYDVKTSNTPFIGVSSQSKSRSILTYYGIENHSKWLFTPMFRGTGTVQTGGGRPTNNRNPVVNSNVNAIN